METEQEEQTYCPECKAELQEVEVNAQGYKTYYCKECMNRFIIDREY